MSFCDKWEAAIGSKDLDAMVKLMHPDCAMVLHSPGKVLHSDEWKESFGKLIQNEGFKRDRNRCIYENDDIMVSHSFVTFPNGTSDAVMYVGILKDGKLLLVRARLTLTLIRRLYA